ncbi:MAG: hypothetical protein ACI3Z0_00545 [Candidatus Cryptobacteroides sp.]
MVHLDSDNGTNSRPCNLRLVNVTGNEVQQGLAAFLVGFRTGLPENNLRNRVTVTGLEENYAQYPCCYKHYTKPLMNEEQSHT